MGCLNEVGRAGNASRGFVDGRGRAGRMSGAAPFVNVRARGYAQVAEKGGTNLCNGCGRRADWSRSVGRIERDLWPYGGVRCAG